MLRKNNPFPNKPSKIRTRACAQARRAGSRVVTTVVSTISQAPFGLYSRPEIHPSRVKQAESKQIVNALRKANKPVEYLVYTNEGHYFLHPENKRHLYATIEAFLAKHLGSRIEPPGKIESHSALIK
ncbi:MAG: prolyl oligopeptidase family serine peptidase [Nitrospira sp.]